MFFFLFIISFFKRTWRNSSNKTIKNTRKQMDFKVWIQNKKLLALFWRRKKKNAFFFLWRKYQKLREECWQWIKVFKVRSVCVCFSLFWIGFPSFLLSFLLYFCMANKVQYSLFFFLFFFFKQREVFEVKLCVKRKKSNLNLHFLNQKSRRKNYKF